MPAKQGRRVKTDVKINVVFLGLIIVAHLFGFISVIIFFGTF